MPTLTVFTPSYNRVDLLPRLYKSLVEQTCKDFIWLVIDDGSTDHTKEVVEKWVKDALIEIRYVFKENGGMHTAHNLAYSIIESEINICIDSDDFMPKNAVENILINWEKVSYWPNIAGMIGLDESIDGHIIGSEMPCDMYVTSFDDLYHKCKVKGDKKLVYRSSITNAYPKYPEFDGERLVPLSRLYNLIDRDYQLVCFNSVWVIVDYQEGGSSNTIIDQYFRSPKGFREARITKIKCSSDIIAVFKNVIHLGCCNIILKDWKAIINSPRRIYSIVLMPVSLILYFFLKYKRDFHKK